MPPSDPRALRALLLSALAAATSLFFAAGAQAGEPLRPADPSARVLAEVTLPDLRATLDRIEGAVSSVAPGTLPPGALLAMAGAKLKDPGLAALGSGPLTLMLVAPEAAGAAPGAVLFIPARDAAAYQDATAALGFASSSAGGLVIAASDARSLVAGRALEARYRRLSSGPAAAGDVSITLHADTMMGLYGPVLRVGAASALDKLGHPAAAPSGMPAAFPAAILRLEMLGGLAVLEQVRELRVDIELPPGAITSRTVITARPGTPLAALAEAPPVAGPNRAAGLLEGTGTMAATYQLDPHRVTDFVVDLARSIQAQSGPDSAITPAVLDVLREAGDVYTGQAALRMSARPGALPPFATEAVAGVTDEKRALAAFQKSFDLLVPLMEAAGGGAFPMHFTLETDVRRTGGVAVHRLRAAVDPSKLPSEQKAASALLAFTTEFAFVNGYSLSTQDPATLDRLVARAAGGGGAAVPLQAEKTFGPGRQVYVDYDFIGLLRTMPVLGPGPSPFAALPAGDMEPATYTVGLGEGTLRFEARMPLGPIAALVGAGKKAAAGTKVSRP